MTLYAQVKDAEVGTIAPAPTVPSYGTDTTT